MEDNNGTRQNTVNAVVDRAAIGGFFQIHPRMHEVVGQVLLVQSPTGQLMQQRRHVGACSDCALVHRIEDGIAAHWIAHAHEVLLAGVPDREGKIAFEVLQAFRPALKVDRKRQRGVAVFRGITHVHRRQIQPSAQVCSVVEPPH